MVRGRTGQKAVGETEWGSTEPKGTGWGRINYNRTLFYEEGQDVAESKGRNIMEQDETGRGRMKQGKSERNAGGEKGTRLSRIRQDGPY